jgi:hypothetical protein
MPEFHVGGGTWLRSGGLFIEAEKRTTWQGTVQRWTGQNPQFSAHSAQFYIAIAAVRRLASVAEYSSVYWRALCVHDQSCRMPVVTS